MACKIRFCEHNSGKGKVFRNLKEAFPDLDIKIKKCIKQCAVCRETPMATVDGKRVVARDGDELFARLDTVIREKPARNK